MANKNQNDKEQKSTSSPYPENSQSSLELSQESIKERSFDFNRLFDIAKVRESNHPQFDGMSYMKYNETNEMADISYLPPKQNKMDSRITTGITHEKDSSLISFFMNMKFEGNITVFYRDQELYDLSVALTNWVRKSREVENYDWKRPIFYRNFVSQGTSFTLEKYCERYVPKKIVESEEVDYTRMDEIKWKDAGMEKVYDGCESILVDGKKVFLEDIRQPDIQKQPGVYMVEYIPREMVESVWGKTKRWKLVPSSYTDIATMLTQGSIYSDWLFSPVDIYKCAVVQVFRPFEGRYQIYINGIPMLEPNFPLKVVSPTGLIPIAKGDMDLMNMFAYSKSEPAKTKIDQAVFDKVLQNMLVKFQQSAFVPRGNLSGKIYDASILMGGRMVSDLDPKKIPPLIDDPGIKQADFSFYQLIREQIDSKTISALLEGNPVPGNMTLGQYMDMQKKQLLKLGGKLDGIINWERDMLRLRLADLVYNGIRKTGKMVKGEMGMKNEYMDVSVDAELSSGDRGMSIIKFDDETMMTPEDVFDEQNQYQEETGRPAEIIYVNPSLLKKIFSDPNYHIRYEVTPVDKNNDKLAQIMYVSMITQAAQIFGMESLRVERLKKRYAAKMGESFDDLFKSEQELELARMETLQAATAGGAVPGTQASGAPGAAPAELPPMKDVMLQP